MATQLRALRVPILAIYLLLAALFVVAFFHITARPAQAANPQRINFQGKVTNSDGTNVSNGSYDFDFILYDDPTAGVNRWQETWNSGTSQLSVTNGIFQVELGTHTALPNFNTYPNLYLAIKFNNDAAGYMTPRVRLTSAPYALNSDALGGLASTNFVQLAQGLQTDASTTQASIAINKTNASGTPNILQLQKSNSDVLVVANGGQLTLSPVGNNIGTIIKQTSGTATSGNVFDVQTANGSSSFIVITNAAANEGELTIQSVGATRNLTLGSGSGTIITTASTLQKAANAFTIDLATAASSTLTLTNSDASNVASLSVEGDVAVGSGRVYKVGATSGASTTCSSGNVLTDQVVVGGITTGGTCAAAGGTTKLAAAYAAGASQTDSTILLDSTRLGVLIRDNATPISGNLFAVQKTAGSVTYLGVTATGVNIQSNATGSAVDALAVDTSTTVPHLKIFGSNGTSYADIYYDTTSSQAIFGASTGTAVLGSGTGSVNIAAGAGAAVTITGNAASTISTTAGALTFTSATAATWSTTAGNLSLQAGSGTVQIASSILAGSGALSVQSGAATALTVTGNAASTWSTSAGNLTLQGGAALILDAASGSTITIGNTGSGNYAQFAATTRELSFTGSARHTRVVSLVPEYPGAVLTGDGSNNTGTMTSDFCSGSSLRNIPSASNPCSASVEHNYYTWVTTAQNDYDIWIRWQVPSDFSDFSASSPINMYGWRTDSTATTTVDLSLYNASGTLCGSTTNVATGTAAWTSTALSGTITSAGCSISAGNVVTFRIQMNANNKTVRAGEISVSYLSKW